MTVQANKRFRRLLGAAFLLSSLAVAQSHATPHAGIHTVRGSDGSFLIMPSGVYDINNDNLPVSIISIEVLDHNGQATEDIGLLYPYKSVTLYDGTQLPKEAAINEFETVLSGVLWNFSDQSMRIFLDGEGYTGYLTLESGQGIAINNADALLTSHQMACACKCGPQTITVPCPINTPDNNTCGCENANNIPCAITITTGGQEQIVIHSTANCTRMYVRVSP
jgi:hypothetical protein